MNKHILSLGLLLNALSISLILADAQSILPGGCIRKDPIIDKSQEITSVALQHYFIVETYLDKVKSSDDGRWALCEHDGLELIYSLISKPTFKKGGMQIWTFKPLRLGFFTLRFIRNEEIKTVLINVYHAWCGTGVETRIITF